MKLEISEELSSKLNELRKESNTHFEKGDYRVCIKLMLQSWDMLPEPKENTSDSFHISRSLAGNYLKLNELDPAEEWANKLLKCARHRMDFGEREMMMAEVKFAKGEFENVREVLKVADKISKGKVWRICPKELIDFFKKK